MKTGPSWRWLPLALVALVALFVAAPGAFGFSRGITSDNAGVPEFAAMGCVACHGGGASAPHDWADQPGNITWSILDPEGDPPIGNMYTHGTEYTITITLDEQVAPGATNHAGFNLRVNAGTFAAVEGSSQVSGDGLQATHTAATSTEWNVTWTAPEHGAAVFDLFVNDVDGDAVPSAGDQVHRAGWYLTDEEFALPGAVEEHEVHVGVPLPQYWLGLIALAGMIGIMVFGFVYMKYMSPHHSDQKDR